MVAAKSAYVSPLHERAERKGQLTELVDFLKQVRRDVEAGESLTACVGDGTLWGWRARVALGHCVGEPLANWDAQPGRTQLERRAVVERALGELGVTQRRGGWVVSR